MKCVNCASGFELKHKKINHHYRECGLDNVWLKGAVFYECRDCGATSYGLGNIVQLHDCIAEILIKKNIFTGAEARFLRKNLGLSGTEFARQIGITREHLSRIERDAVPISQTFVVLLKALTAIKCKDRDYDVHDALKEGVMNVARIDLRSSSTGWRAATAA